MPITFKHINILDSDQIKIDAINYNFDQLVANGGGPRGPQGSIGQSGPQGITGYQGSRGLAGTLGNQGPASPANVSYWKQIAAQPDKINAVTLVPIHTTGDQWAPVINIGHLESDDEYKNKQALIDGKTPYQWVIYRKSHVVSNLRFKNQATPDHSYDFKLDKPRGNDVADGLTMRFIDTSGGGLPKKTATSIDSNKTTFKSSSIGEDNFNISPQGAEFKVKTEFNLPVNIKGNLIIENAGAKTNSIIISQNNDGLVKFKQINELLGNVPGGAIVSIQSEIFGYTNNFISEESVSVTDNTSLKITVGKGIGDYTGWYLCNGKEWKNDDDDITYQVPMLGNFKINIEEDPNSKLPNSQGTVDIDTDSKHINGGSTTGTVSSFVSNLETGSKIYNVTSEVNTGDSLTNLNCGLNLPNGTSYKIKKLPQIIYLGRNDLYWSDKGTGQNPVVGLTFNLIDINTSPSKLTSNPYFLGTVIDKSADASYSVAYEVVAPSGYWWSTIPPTSSITGVPSWATISSITPVGTGANPTKISILIAVSDHPDGNGNIVNLGINTLNSIVLFTIPINFVRVDSEFVTCDTALSTNITYNFQTGYTFQLVYTAKEGYEFKETTPPILTSSSQYMTITGSSVSNLGETLTIFIKVEGIPNIGYPTKIDYEFDLKLFAIPPTVTIGTQTWTTKNLNVTTYRDGTRIPQHKGNAEDWAKLKTGAWCWYNQDFAHGKVYGRMYNWYAVMGIHEDESAKEKSLPLEQRELYMTFTRFNERKILAPLGYHVPSQREWSRLITHLSAGSSAEYLGVGVGDKLKSTGIGDTIGLWNPQATKATNETGFTALPGGLTEETETPYRLSGILFYKKTIEFWRAGKSCKFWAKEQIKGTEYTYSPFGTDGYPKNLGVSLTNNSSDVKINSAFALMYPWEGAYVRLVQDKDLPLPITLTIKPGKIIIVPHNTSPHVIQYTVPLDFTGGVMLFIHKRHNPGAFTTLSHPAGESKFEIIHAGYKKATSISEPGRRKGYFTNAGPFDNRGSHNDDVQQLRQTEYTFNYVNADGDQNQWHYGAPTDSSSGADNDRVLSLPLESAELLAETGIINPANGIPVMYDAPEKGKYPFLDFVAKDNLRLYGNYYDTVEKNLQAIYRYFSNPQKIAVWWKYTAADYAVNPNAVIRITSGGHDDTSNSITNCPFIYMYDKTYVPPPPPNPPPVIVTPPPPENVVLKVGDAYGGGTIGYIFNPSQGYDYGFTDNKQHGFIVSGELAPAGAPWGCPTLDIGGGGAGQLNENNRVMTRDGFGYGRKNTEAIVKNCPDANGAARLCADYSVPYTVIENGQAVLKTYNDWFLPSRYELKEILDNAWNIPSFENLPRISGDGTGFDDYFYWWSSTQNPTDKLEAHAPSSYNHNYYATTTLTMAYDDGFGNLKTKLCRVRAVRVF